MVEREKLINSATGNAASPLVQILVTWPPFANRPNFWTNSIVETYLSSSCGPIRRGTDQKNNHTHVPTLLCLKQTVATKRDTGTGQFTTHIGLSHIGLSYKTHDEHWIETSPFPRNCERSVWKRPGRIGVMLKRGFERHAGNNTLNQSCLKQHNALHFMFAQIHARELQSCPHHSSEHPGPLPTKQPQKRLKTLSQCHKLYFVLELSLLRVDREEKAKVLSRVAAATTGDFPSLLSSAVAAGACEAFVFAFPLYVRCWFDSCTGLSAFCSWNKFRSVAPLKMIHVHLRVRVLL